MMLSPFLQLPVAIAGSSAGLLDPSKVSPIFPAPAEFSAKAHWMFGSDRPDFNDLLTGRTLDPLGPAPTLASNYVSFADGYSGLGSDIDVHRDQTLCFVLRYVAPHDYAMIGGHWDVGDFINNLWIASGAYYVQTWREGGGEPSAPGIASPIGVAVGDWLFFAVAWSQTSVFVKWGGSYTQNDTVVMKERAGAKLYVGPAHPATTDNPALAEAIVFDAPLSEASIDQVYARSKARMAARGIMVK